MRVRALSLLATLVAIGCSGGPSKTNDGGADAGPSCQSRSDCPTGELCAAADAGPARCAGCATNGQCKPQELCDSQNLCVFRPGYGDQCALNGDCATGQFCKQGLCVAPAGVTLCVRNTCPSGQRCNIQNQVCEQNLGCTGDGDCLPTQTCNLGTLVCVPRCDPADAGAVCDPVQQCVANRCVDCVKNADCGAGLSCDLTSGQCTASGLCFSDSTCLAGTVCDLATNTCVAKLVPCTSDDGCARGQVCDAISGQCVLTTCQADQFYPNQSMATAAPITVGASYSNLTLCGPTDQDWYALSLLSGDQLQVTIDTDQTGSGYSFDVQLLNDAGTVLADGPNLVLVGSAPQAGTYYLKMTDGDPACLYGFRTLVSHGQPCPPNPFGQIDTQASAAFIDGGVGPIYLCAAQANWFEVARPTGGLSVTLGCDPTQGPLAIAALLADGGLLAQSNDGNPIQTLSLPGGSGLVALEVTGSGQTNAYTLALTALAVADAGSGATQDAGTDGGALANP